MLRTVSDGISVLVIAFKSSSRTPTCHQMLVVSEELMH